MENIGNWNATQKKILLALRTVSADSYEENRRRATNNLVATLKANNLLRTTSYNLEEVIMQTMDSWREDVAKGKFGLSLTGTIYNKLFDLGCLK